jgi:hypothetical protein
MEEPGLDLPSQTPLFHAQHADRYRRQGNLRQFEAEYGCRLIVVGGPIYDFCVPMFEDALTKVGKDDRLCVMISSPGGDGETALRMVRSAHERCSELVVIVPDQAKSAATIFALGADRILMGTSSDLGPIDPQISVASVRPAREPEFVAARQIIEAVRYGEESIKEHPDTYPLHATLLGQITGLTLQQAKFAMDRTSDLVIEMLESCPRRSSEAAAQIWDQIKGPLFEDTTYHATSIGYKRAKELGLPVDYLKPDDKQWKDIWFVYCQYLQLFRGGSIVYEGQVASHIVAPVSGPPPQA